MEAQLDAAPSPANGIRAESWRELQGKISGHELVRIPCASSAFRPAKKEVSQLVQDRVKLCQFDGTSIDVDAVAIGSGDAEGAES
ncbi:hypothetical protein ACFVYG_20365 [Streptomyces sp. NPDC058256]|uniref:hypothetical protein n=1 Tax=Streptomyces sp. NPDC058256 TaxID=3346408 RepID=UPI0036E77038